MAEGDGTLTVQETQEIETKDSLDIQDRLSANIRFITGVNSLMLWQNSDEVEYGVLMPVFHEMDMRICQIDEDSKELCNRLSKFEGKEKEKESALEEERRKSRPVSDEEIEEARGFVAHLQRKQAEQKERGIGNGNN